MTYESEVERVLKIVGQLAQSCKWKPDTQTKGRLFEDLITDFLDRNTLKGSGHTVATGCIAHPSLANKNDTLRQIDLMVFDESKGEGVLFFDGSFAVIDSSVARVLISAKLNLDGDAVKKELKSFSSLLRSHVGTFKLVFFAFFAEPRYESTVKNWIPEDYRDQVKILYLKLGSTTLSDERHSEHLETDLLAFDKLDDIVRSQM